MLLISHLTDLLTATDSLPIQGKYKVWICRNYIISFLQFHLCVDAVSNSSIAKLEGLRLSWYIMDFFSCLQLFKHTVLNLTSLAGGRTWCPIDLQHLCCKALINKESIATRFLKKRLNLPRSVTHVILYYPDACCPSSSHALMEAKLSLLACVNSSSELRLQELN